MTEQTPHQTPPPSRPSTEVVEKPVRRRFSAEYKQRILAAADACTEVGELGQLLRREGLYSSHLTAWRKQREEGIQDALGRTRGRKPAANPLLAEENARLRAENQRLQMRLNQAQTIIEVQKKLSMLLGLEGVQNGMPF
jgi:transposase